MSQHELEDDPLTDEQEAQDAILRDRSRAHLASKAAQMGMTPMEYIAAGHAVAQMPEDSLRYDESRQLAAPSTFRPMPAASLNAPQVPIRDRMQEWLEKDRGRAFMEGFNDYFDPAPPAQALEAVPGPDIIDDDIIDAELVEDDDI